MDKMSRDKQFALIRSNVEKALELLKTSEDTQDIRNTEAVNWADLKCVQISYCITEEDEAVWTVLIEEAAPNASQFQLFVWDYVMINTGISIEVSTEW